MRKKLGLVVDFKLLGDLLKLKDTEITNIKFDPDTELLTLYLQPAGGYPTINGAPIDLWNVNPGAAAPITLGQNYFMDGR